MMQAGARPPAERARSICHVREWSFSRSFGDV